MCNLNDEEARYLVARPCSRRCNFAEEDNVGEPRGFRRGLRKVLVDDVGVLSMNVVECLRLCGIVLQRVIVI